MPDNAKPSITVSFGAFFPIFLVFLVLKLTNTVDWSWFWVVSPLIVPFALVILWLVVYIIIITFSKRY